MKEYSILYKGISEDKKTFYFSLNAETGKSLIIRVYNQYLKNKEYETLLEVEPEIQYWTYFPSNSKNRYVEFRDSKTLEVVGLFALEGVFDIKDVDYNFYIKNIVSTSNEGEKLNILTVFNEIFCMNMYNNDFINVEENDLVIDIGFNYGFFTMQSLKFNPYKIIGFEPNIKLVNQFTHFIKHDKIELYQAAVSEKNGEGIFYENFDPKCSSIIESYNTNNRINSYKVNLIGFYDFIVDNEIKKIDFLKVDCEGAEYGIFESIPIQYLKNNIRKISIEYHHSLNDEKVIGLINKLKKCDFELSILNEQNSPLGMIYAKK